MPTELTKFAASVAESWIDGGNLHDTAFRKRPFLDMVVKAGMIDSKPTGKEFQTNIRTGRNTNFQFYKGLDTWTINPDSGYVQGKWSMRQSVLPWVLPSDDIIYNAEGPSLFNIVSETLFKAAESLSEELNLRFINRTSGTGPTGLDMAWLSLQDLIGDEQSTLTTVGEIDALDYHWHRSMIKRPGFTLPVDPLEANGWTRDTDPNIISGGPYNGWQALLLDDITKMIMQLEENGGKPDLVLCRKDLIQVLMKAIKAEFSVVQTDLTGTLSAGYDGVVWMGVPFVAERQVRAGEMFFINKDAVRVRIQPRRWLTSRPATGIYNQDAEYGAIFAWAQMYTRDRRLLGKFEKVAPIA